MSPQIPSAYADVVRAFGVGKDTDIKNIGKGDVIVVGERRCGRAGPGVVPAAEGGGD